MRNCLLINTDGGARGNPGPAAIGVCIFDSEGKSLANIGKTIGIATNNVAEYMAVIEAFKWLSVNINSEINYAKFLIDSSLVVNQLNGVFKIKEQHLRELIVQIKEFEHKLGIKISYQHIPREKNFAADKLVNQSLDSSR